MTDAELVEHRSGCAEDRCPPITASDSITFMDTFLVDMLVRFGMTRLHVAVYSTRQSLQTN